MAALDNIARDNEGYLVNVSDWNKTIAEELAQEESLQLEDAHWEIIELLRDFYDEFEQSPAMRIMVKQAALKLGKEKGSSIYFMRLFPGSPAKLASKLAGLPKPLNCL
ncbi:TusE/DsrC/DsvC family sulfur relay protein [uncultured Pseudoteredinibacter sp.]|uniref:TusE/DsrC/DsvC family sulfur relay protein n=1 Tax=uncultured Pseudoteredinibacter sp. TaxID=1641701 RepID=UPI00261E002A|nr:TusE/DsrC/DsvC family sulfur relay protein [uncultured Pseudoteredinibacter sp.]